MSTSQSAAIREVNAWLVDGARSGRTPSLVLGELCDRLVGCGVPLWRVALFVRTLHPEIMGNRFLWQQSQGVTVLDAPFEMLETPLYLTSPVARVYQTGERMRFRLQAANSPSEFPVLDELSAEGGTDYLVSPLTFTNGERHVVTWATRAPGGFSSEAIADLDAIVPALARATEVRALRRTAVNLLNTYVGRQAGERILSGQVRRGYSEAIHGVVWLSDMRGFTALADRLQPQALLELLNRYFDCQVPAIVAQGGEVLKFMGDGLLAIFPVSADGEGLARVCVRALQAARTAAAAIEALGTDTAVAQNGGLRFGLALHVGDFLYGNVGGGNRLDFTCIGPGVNLAARLEKLAARLQQAIVASEAFAAQCPDEFVRLGDFTLAGFRAAQAVYGAKPGE